MPIPTPTGSEVELPGWTRAFVILAAGIALSGFADFALSQVGYDTLAAWVWAAGYAGTVLVLFFLYLQPMELTGPDGESED